MPRVTHGHLPSQSGRITMAADAMRARSKSVCLSSVSPSSMNGTLETHSISQPFTRKYMNCYCLRWRYCPISTNNNAIVLVVRNECAPKRDVLFSATKSKYCSFVPAFDTVRYDHSIIKLIGPCSVFL